MAIGGDTVFEGGDTSRPSPRRPAPPPKHRPSNLLGSSPLGSFRLSPTREASLSAHLRQAAGGTTARPPRPLARPRDRPLSAQAQQESAPFPPHERFVEVEIDLGAGGEASTVIGSDLTREYVDINADYRS